MTDQTTTPEPDDSPFRSMGGMGGMLALIASGAALLWSFFRGRVDREGARESDRERAIYDQLELLQKMRMIEREEEQHRATMRWNEERLRTQVDIQDVARAERLEHDARRRAAELEEAYWRAKLVPATLTGKDALALAKAHFETHVLEGTEKQAGYAFAQFIEELGKKLEES